MNSKCKREIGLIVVWMIMGIVLSSTFVQDASNEPSQLKTVWLSSLVLDKMTSGWGTPQADKSVQNKPITIAGRQFEKGVGTHALSVMYIDVQNCGGTFSAFVGVDDEVGTNTGTVRFQIYGDEKKLYDSGVMKTGQKAK